MAKAPWVEKRFRYRLTDPLGALRQAMTTSDADYLLPADDLAVCFLHELAAQDPSLRPLIEGSIGERSFFPAARSRLNLLSIAREMGIAAPRTELIGNGFSLEDWYASHSAPFVLKKDGTWGGKGVKIVSSLTQAHDAYKELLSPTPLRERLFQWLRTGDRSALARLDCLNHPEITAQSLVTGVPANSMYACYKGRVLGEVQARVVASRGKLGPSLVVQLQDDWRITRAGTLIAKRLQLSGFFGLDFMIDAETGEPQLIEMNPRSTQLGHLAVAGQSELAAHLWAQWSGSELPPPAAQHLEAAVSFYPYKYPYNFPYNSPYKEQSSKQGSAQDHTTLRGCRSDINEGEAELLAALASSTPAFRTRLRALSCSSIAMLKGKRPGPNLPEFYHHDGGHTELSALHPPETCEKVPADMACEIPAGNNAN